MPYCNIDKFEINNLEELSHNPFVTARKALKAPRDRFFKYRLLHGDVFCSKRMFKFKMVDSPNCKYCTNVIETIKHLVWDCPRSTRAWSYVNVNNLTSPKLGRIYIDYNSIILGNEQLIPAMEVIIVWVLRMIMSIEREQQIQNEAIFSQIRTVFRYEENSFGLYSSKMLKRWGNLIDIFHVTD